MVQRFKPVEDGDGNQAINEHLQFLRFLISAAKFFIEGVHSVRDRLCSTSNWISLVPAAFFGGLL